jgi:hypothetical protein
MRFGLRDLSKCYNTRLTPEQEQAFQQNATAGSRFHSRDLLQDLADYDMRAAHQAGIRFDESGHGTDEYKKPSHPTFSDESIYSAIGVYGGKWFARDGTKYFLASSSNRAYWTQDQLQRYFQECEPEVELIYNHSGPHAITRENRMMDRKAQWRRFHAICEGEKLAKLDLSVSFKLNRDGEFIAIDDGAAKLLQIDPGSGIGKGFFPHIAKLIDRYAEKYRDRDMALRRLQQWDMPPEV